VHDGGSIPPVGFTLGGGTQENMKRRKFIIGTGALAVGSAAAVVTGAFTSVSAARSVDVAVAGDESALLALRPCSGPNGAYANIGEDGQFELNVPNLNGNAFTRIDEVFEMVNQGTQPVVVYIEERGGNTVVADIGAKAGELARGPEDEEQLPGTNGIAGDDVFDVSRPSSPGFGETGIKLDEGESVKLGVYADTSDGNVNDGLDESSGAPLTGDDVEIWDGLTIYADAEAAEAGNYRFEETNSNG
jgi:hypothetical protein